MRYHGLISGCKFQPVPKQNIILQLYYNVFFLSVGIAIRENSL
jgi:hypothetical protein